MTRKIRILHISESSYLSTGFSTMTREIMSRLHSTGLFELCELGCYGTFDDARQREIPWQYYSNMPKSEEEKGTYESKISNQFGEFRFEEVCLKFRPDCVFDFRDVWMSEFISRSPFRKNFYWTYMPTIDAEPCGEQYLATYANANAVFTYTQWAYDLLKREGSGLIKLNGVASPGADFNTFNIIENKEKLRQQCGLQVDSLILGTVMRNQKRKLFPDLCKAFSKFLMQSSAEIARRSYLYFHTSYPDIGWDIPRILKENGIAHKIYFTYHCKRCNAIFPSLFMDVRGYCKNCNGPFAVMPNSLRPITNNALNLIYNLFDIYVQYSTNEGLGLPTVEAAACGVPIMAVDYSGMKDIISKLQAIPISVKTLYRECETHFYKAAPDEDCLISSLISLFNMNPEDRVDVGKLSRELAKKHFNYDNTTNIFLNHFNSIKIMPHKQTWLAPPRFHQPNMQCPDNLNNEQLVKWALYSVAGRPDLLNTYTALRMIRDLNNEAKTDKGTGGLYINEECLLGQQHNFMPFGRKELVEECLKIAQQYNMWEQKRVELLKY